MNLCVPKVCVYGFLCFPCYFVIEEYYGILFISLPRFNKADLFRFQSFPVGVGFQLRLIFLHGLLILGFKGWYIYVWIFILERRPHCVPFWVSFSEIKLICHESLNFYSYQLLPVRSYTCSTFLCSRFFVCIPLC